MNDTTEIKKTFKELTETKRQELGGRLVQHEIMCNASTIVSNMSRHEPDEWIELFGHYDYEEAARYHIESIMTNDDIGEYLDDKGIKEEFDKKEDYVTWKNQLLASLKYDEDYQEFCDDQGVEPDFDDVLEHWIVSDWLARKIEAYGGTVEHDFHGLTIWGRYTSGQAIALDYMIQKIAYDIYM